MKVIFATTNKRKIEDLQNISNKLKFNLEILGIDDINWNLGEIEENGKTIDENFLIKARAIYNFCKANNINYPIITDDAGLFCDALDGEPGIYTARYADDEIVKNPNLPKYQCVIKLLRNLNGVNNRKASYKFCVTCMLLDGTYFQEFGRSKGAISKTIIGKLEKPYFYSVFILEECNKVFSELNEDELLNTYRYEALKKTLVRLKKIINVGEINDK